MEYPPEIKSHIKNPLLEEALKLLTNSVNLNTGLVHKSDRYAAVQLFRRLREAGIEWDPKKYNIGPVATAGNLTMPVN